MSKINKSLKQSIALTPRERRISMEDFIDNDLHEKDARVALDYIEEQRQKIPALEITEIGYSDSGELTLNYGSGIIFLK